MFCFSRRSLFARYPLEPLISTLAGCLVTLGIGEEPFGVTNTTITIEGDTHIVVSSTNSPKLIILVGLAVLGKHGFKSFDGLFPLFLLHINLTQHEQCISRSRCLAGFFIPRNSTVQLFGG